MTPFGLTDVQKKIVKEMLFMFILTFNTAIFHALQLLKLFFKFFVEMFILHISSKYECIDFFS